MGLVDTQIDLIERMRRIFLERYRARHGDVGRDPCSPERSDGRGSRDPEDDLDRILESARRTPSSIESVGVGLRRSDGARPAAPVLIRRAGWTIRCIFSADEERSYLEFDATHRMTSDRRYRVYGSG